jgi:two-component system cell cycle sensor histidine kinase/response regulator CckA
LQSAGYRVRTAADGKSALKIVPAHSSLDILVTDVDMAPIDGCELAAQMAKANPNLPIIFVSGYLDAQAFRYRGDLVADWTFVRKPVSREELRFKVREASLAAWDARVRAEPVSVLHK